MKNASNTFSSCTLNDKKMTDNFLQPKGDYRELIVYKKAECIYDITFHFVSRFLSRGDRTVDQMVQAARSGKQNIIEGSAASVTSRETEIKLFNVAKASFDELLADYEDYLRVRELSFWPETKQKEVREFCRKNNDSKFYRDIAQQRNDSTLANLAITLIHQELYLLVRLIEKAKRDFLEHGGIKEEMSKARRDYRSRYLVSNHNYENNGNNENNGTNGNSNMPSTPDTPQKI